MNVFLIIAFLILTLKGIEIKADFIHGIQNFGNDVWNTFEYAWDSFVTAVKKPVPIRRMRARRTKAPTTPSTTTTTTTYFNDVATTTNNRFRSESEPTTNKPSIIETSTTAVTTYTNTTDVTSEGTSVTFEFFIETIRPSSSLSRKKGNNEVKYNIYPSFKKKLSRLEIPVLPSPVWRGFEQWKRIQMPNFVFY